MIQKLKGTRDILPSEISKWQYIEGIAKNIFENYGFKEIRVPVIEESKLFQRGVGEQTDVVQKEMYIFEDKGGRSIALRPEGTAGVIRAYIENGMSSLPSPLKVYYRMPMYRYENVQKGRQREFNQIGVELIGTKDYSADVEIILMVEKFFEKLNIKNVELRINSIGCKNCRKDYENALKDYIRPNLDKYCDTCKTRFEKNPMRILDCKEEQCKKLNENAPSILDYLDKECKTHFENVKSMLDKLNIEYTIDSRIVRGLDYYTKTVFEFVSKDDGLTVLGGGRYDDLIEELGSASTPAIGFAAGEERLLQIVEQNNPELSKKIVNNPKIFAAYIGDEANIFAEKLVEKLRDNNIYAEKDIMGRGLNAQFKYANKISAEYVVTIGDNEISTGIAQLKDMKNGTTEDVKIEEIADKLA